jgi:hypothetical protein
VCGLGHARPFVPTYLSRMIQPPPSVGATIVKSIAANPMAMASSARPTTITIPTAVRQALERYKKPGQTYGEILLELMEEFPPKEFLEEMDRRFRSEKRFPIDQLLRDAGL